MDGVYGTVLFFLPDRGQLYCYWRDDPYTLHPITDISRSGSHRFSLRSAQNHSYESRVTERIY